MAQRCKGQETRLNISQDNQFLAEISDIKDHEIEFAQSIKLEDYIGETAKRTDAIYENINGKFTMHISKAAVFSKFIQGVIDKNQRRIPGIIFNVSAVYNFPSGERIRLMIPDVEFGGFPVNTGGRDQYVSIAVTFAASTARIISA